MEIIFRKCGTNKRIQTRFCGRLRIVPKNDPKSKFQALPLFLFSDVTTVNMNYYNVQKRYWWTSTITNSTHQYLQESFVLRPEPTMVGGTVALFTSLVNRDIHFHGRVLCIFSRQRQVGLLGTQHTTSKPSNTYSGCHEVLYSP